MHDAKCQIITVENHILNSSNLDRKVTIDCYIPPSFDPEKPVKLLLVNDGQDLKTMGFNQILDLLIGSGKIEPIFCVGIYCAPDRKNEYGTATILDYKGRGTKAPMFTQFLFQELIPFIRKQYEIETFLEKAYAGFSLGGLCALDIVWAHPHEFTKVGVFSGSLWWRDKNHQDRDFNENKNRIMHKLVRQGNYAGWLKFFFEVGTKDETADRNNNGIIDSIDDTLGLIVELVDKGYTKGEDIFYMEMQDGRHDVPTWAKAFPDFLRWGWGKDQA